MNLMVALLDNHLCCPSFPIPGPQHWFSRGRRQRNFWECEYGGAAGSHMGPSFAEAVAALWGGWLRVWGWGLREGGGSLQGDWWLWEPLSITHVETKGFLRGAQPHFSPALSGFFSHFLPCSWPPCSGPQSWSLCQSAKQHPSGVLRQVLRPQLLSFQPRVRDCRGKVGTWGLHPGWWPQGSGSSGLWQPLRWCHGVEGPEPMGCQQVSKKDKSGNRSGWWLKGRGPGGWCRIEMRFPSALMGCGVF